MLEKKTLLVTSLALGGFLSPGLAKEPPRLDRITPERGRVQQSIALHGHGFGAYSPGECVVLFETAAGVLEAGTPRVWRDDFIQIQVPGGVWGDARRPMPQGTVQVRVLGSHGRRSRDRPCHCGDVRVQRRQGADLRHR